MADGQNAERRCHTQQDKAVFGIGMVWIIEQKSLLIEERGLGLFKRDPDACAGSAEPWLDPRRSGAPPSTTS
jgi:hypothetical protein